MELQGKVIAVLEPQKFVSKKNGNEYVKNFFVIETGGQYPKKIAFSVMGDERWNRMNITMDGTYNVSFDIESHEWNGRWFTECGAWQAIRIDSQQKKDDAPAPQPEAHIAETANDSPEGDLPF